MAAAVALTFGTSARRQHTRSSYVSKLAGSVPRVDLAGSFLYAVAKISYSGYRFQDPLCQEKFRASACQCGVESGFFAVETLA